MKKTLHPLLLILLLNSCGYHWASSHFEKSLEIPYVIGDEDGSFTSELIRSFAAEGPLVRNNAPYRLEVSLVQAKNEVISYRIDPQKITGKKKKEIVADQNRKTAAVEVTLFEGAQIVFGPHRISASAEYDYYDGDSYQDLSFQLEQKRLTALAFSLGQLESSETAQEAASRPLYRQLSKKIVDCIIQKL